MNGCVKQEQALSELQVTACDGAERGHTCDTKLDDLGIVTKEQCCNVVLLGNGYFWLFISAKCGSDIIKEQ